MLLKLTSVSPKFKFFSIGSNMIFKVSNYCFRFIDYVPRGLFLKRPPSEKIGGLFDFSFTHRPDVPQFETGNLSIEMG